MIFSTLSATATDLAAKPAGGAALDQVAIATGGATVVTLILLWLVSGHRSGKTPWLGRAADFASRKSGLPHWAALPTAIAAISLNVALLGMYWDIALHIDLGRDEGPLANPAHYLILVGLYGVFAAGALAIALPRPGERPGPAALRLTDDWHAPVGGVLMAACGGFALIGFPLDDMWHRLFGQDVTLWGPTHLMLIGGAGMTLVGQAVLLSEGMKQLAIDRGERPRRGGSEKMPSAIVALRRAGIVGGFLIGLSTFQAEFDFGVPQFRLVFQPFLIALAAGVALVAGRLWIGRGGAIATAVFFLGLRGLISLIVGPVLGETTPSLPLYLGSAVLVEIVALFLIRRPLAFGVVAGAVIGTLGFATEYAWSHLVMDLPWTPDLLPEGLLMSLAAGLAGGAVGALLATGLRTELPRPAIARGALVVSGLLVAICVVSGLQAQVPGDVRGQVQLTDVPGGEGRQAVATVRIDPERTGDRAWLTATAWQGGGLVVDRLEEVSDGLYRSTRPLPIDGDWKTLIRLHDGRDLAAIPVFLPNDPAIPAPEIPAERSFERPFVAEIDLLQRERKDDVAGWIWAAASALVLALYLVFLGALAWGVGRLARSDDEPGGPSSDAPARRTGAPERPGRVPATV